MKLNIFLISLATIFSLTSCVGPTAQQKKDYTGKRKIIVQKRNGGKALFQFDEKTKIAKLNTSDTCTYTISEMAVDAIFKAVSSTDICTKEKDSERIFCDTSQGRDITKNIDGLEIFMLELQTVVTNSAQSGSCEIKCKTLKL